MSSPVPPSTSASAAANAAPVPNQLQFTATTIDGAEFSGASLAGRRTVLWFWTPWCPTCQREASMIAETADAYPDVQFVGVAAQDDVPAMREFVSEYGVKFPTIADTDGAVWQRFGVTAQPAFAFISKYSDVDIVPGTLSEADLAAQIAALG
ncbi:redoxin family protein [Nocardia sp. CNY236]|uniref:redoxin family protein n=1 Tax=Nocardia sp. CNY236 TaxID=1169152 RepID=UPI0018CAF15F|nr:redoxin family protein [Nocardia sp. CNY236]